eukprot:TRINITY_DN1230_c0_g1_i2.p1 TRINITY_DN1230_c0_g1~~TRINITY_DN1230_c0_g1_i2.p1  ORF type:complete len:239 (+),score=50.72 TRINITY_DN1230_c0_g1_i2:129-845(+)
MQKLSPENKEIANTLLTLLYLVSFVLSMLGDIINNGVLMGVFKMLFVPTLSLLVRINWNGPYTKRYLVLQVALFAAWVGDFFIFFARFNLLYFTIGGLLFFAQQLIYVYLNVSAMDKNDTLTRISHWGLPFIAYIAVINLSFSLSLELFDKVSSLVYLLSVATCYYTAFYISTQNKIKFWACIIGFAFFTASDIIITIERFGGKLTRVQSSMILLTYYIAQTLICYSLNPDKESVKSE